MCVDRSCNWLLVSHPLTLPVSMLAQPGCLGRGTAPADLVPCALPMQELVTKKMELAELHEQHLKQGRELRWAQQQALATEAKLAKLEAIIFSKAATPKPPTAADIQISGLIPAAHA